MCPEVALSFKLSLFCLVGGVASRCVTAAAPARADGYIRSSFAFAGHVTHIPEEGRGHSHRRGLRGKPNPNPSVSGTEVLSQGNVWRFLVVKAESAPGI